MKSDKNGMSIEERTMFELHALYEKYGYSRYKMGKFEEYDLYVRNKDFISAESIITFGDITGKLKALKPDLTLSIVKNYRYLPGYDQKLYYSENIYRASQDSGTYREIMQTGLECMGDIGLYDTFEVTMLAVRSLAAISGDYMLQVSHLGLIESFLDPIPEALHAEVLQCMGRKNLHEMRQILEENEVDDEAIRNLEFLGSTYGDHRRVLEKVSKLPCNEKGKKAIEELSDVIGLLDAYDLAERVKIDFSIVSNLKYYSGILFKGYINGVPEAVLSGGRYDKLMTRMHKKGGALGFAVYLDGLEYLNREKREYDVDVLFLYTLEDDLTEMFRVVSRLTAEGKTVLVEKRVPDSIRYRKVVRLSGSEVIELE